MRMWGQAYLIAVATTPTPHLIVIEKVGTLIFSWSNKACFEIYSSQYYAGYRFVIYGLYYVDLNFLASPWLLSWKVIGFCQRLFMYLLRLWYYFWVWIHLVMNYIYLFILNHSCFLEWPQLDHDKGFLKMWS